MPRGPKPRPPIERFLDRVQLPDGPLGCWEWSGPKIWTGYAVFYFGPREHPRQGYAHRWAYRRFVGEIPAGMHVDHLCGVRACVNPLHLEAVTPAENNRRSSSVSALNLRKTHCPAGHPYDEANTYQWRRPSGNLARRCRRCNAVARRRYLARRAGDDLSVAEIKEWT